MDSSALFSTCAKHKRPILWAAAASLLSGVVAIWALFAGLPARDELRNLGDTPQATTLYDIHNRPVFTIFREYRIDVPLVRVSPHLRTAIVAIEDQRFEGIRHRRPAHLRSGVGRPAGWAGSARGQHHHPAACQANFSHQ
jgi:hypothetical protein